MSLAEGAILHRKQSHSFFQASADACLLRRVLLNGHEIDLPARHPPRALVNAQVAAHANSRASSIPSALLGGTGAVLDGDASGGAR